MPSPKLMEDNRAQIALNLGGLIADNPAQTRRIQALTSEVRARIAIIDDSLRLQRAGNSGAARDLVASGRGKVRMDEIRALVGAMQAEENRLLQIRLAASEASARQANLTHLLSALFTVGLLGAFYYQLKKHIIERNELLQAETTARTAAETAYQAEQQARGVAENANRLKDEFLATDSHELRTPLNSILGWARMLKTAELDAPTSDRALDAIERNARSQAQLIEDLLDISRIVAGKMRLEIRPLDLAPVLNAALDAVRPAADAKNIRLRAVVDPAAGTISGDAERLQQVVWNLLTNAIKFTPKKGTVELRLERVNSHVEIIVTDNGKGIAPDFLPHVFELFRQADGDITRAHGGLGLGLAIVNRIVEMHGGTVAADSQGAGHGATFTVCLPLRGLRLEVETKSLDGAERTHPTAVSLSADENGVFRFLPSLENLHVLAVDDQPDTLDMISTALARCGATVETANSAQEGFERLQARLPDVLIADIGMPGEDGFSFIKRIRQLDRTRGGKIPAVALTAYARVEDRLKTLSAGFQMHVPKPVEPAELVAVIASLVGRSAEKK